jgi:hypothetical protein
MFQKSLDRVIVGRLEGLRGIHTTTLFMALRL